MRDVITAMLAKLKTKSVSQINAIADKVLPQVHTNLSMTDLISMIPAVTSFNVAESIGWPYETKGATINGVWYGVPSTLATNVEQLHKEVFNDEDYIIPENIISINKKIINKTGYNK